MTQILEEQALPLWKMRILHSQIRSSKEAEENFRAALQVHPLIANGIRPIWLEWLVLTKGIIKSNTSTVIILQLLFYFLLSLLKNSKVINKRVACARIY